MIPFTRKNVFGCASIHRLSIVDLLFIFQGENVGKGGIDVTPSDDRKAPAPPLHLQALTEIQGSPESLANCNNTVSGDISNKRLPRETGEDIGMGSPVPLSSEAVGVITRLRNMKVNPRFGRTWGWFLNFLFRTKMRTGADGVMLSFGLKV